MPDGSTYEVIVAGLGAMGSATLYHLARRGRRVLGLDANPRGHRLGSSHGRSRIIRQAYHEAPEYVPLVQRAYALWRELEQDSQRELMTITGGLLIGEPASGVVSGAVASARLHDLPYERLTPAQVTGRFPGFRLDDNLVAVFEPAAGILQPEACVAAHLELAARLGAEAHYSEPLRSWMAEGSGVVVETEQDSYQAERLAIAPGPWAGEVLTELRLPLAVQRVVNVHFEPAAPELFAPDRCPIYIFEVPEGVYYGFPALPDQGLKFGRHDAGEQCTPRTIRREVDPGEVEMLRSVLDHYMPGASGPAKSTLTCMYTNTPDYHFVIDVHSEHRQVVYACGFSGHGFKFSSVIGEVLADLATEGATAHSIAFLSGARFAQR